MKTFLKEEKILNLLQKAKKASKNEIEDIIQKSLKLKGLSPEDTATLLQCEDHEIIQEAFKTARAIKEIIYGKRLVLFAPLYITNYCVNNCRYCGFRADNKNLKHKRLSLKEIKEEVKILENEGHKRILLVAGEDPPTSNIEFLEKSISIIYSVKQGRGEIRRLNLNVAPLSVKDFKQVKKTGIGTYQLFQETYHLETYRKMHPGGPKADYQNRLYAMHRAEEAGIEDVGIGVLFGLYDYKFEVLALLYHSQELEKEFGVGPHTISVPRVEPALNTPVADHPPAPVSDWEFKKLVAILRLAVPYTGMILSTRETAQIRNEVFGLGISQISAGSRTNPGGYFEKRKDEAAQFSLSDQRSTAEVVKDVLKLGYLPSFCTACYRVGRTGESFMSLAKPGEIHNFCLPNSLLTLKEYLLDYAKDGIRELGEKVISEQIKQISGKGIKRAALQKFSELENGERDLYF